MQYMTAIRPEILEWRAVDGPPGLDVAIGADNTLWLVGLDHRLHRRAGRGWTAFDVDARRVAVSRRGSAWYLGPDGTVNEPTADGWRALSVQADDIAIGADDSVWIVALQGDGTRVLRLVGDEWVADDATRSEVPYPHDVPWTADDVSKIVAEPTTSARLAVAADGLPWVVTREGELLRRVPAGWQLLPEEPATDVAIGPDGNVWIVGRDQRPDGLGVYRFYHGTDWDCYEGAALAIAVDADGLPWTVDAEGAIHDQHVRR